MDVLGSLGDMANTARLILLSDPSHLSEFAGRWQNIATAAVKDQLPLEHALVALSVTLGPQTAPAVTVYKDQMNEGLTKLYDGTRAVAAALRDVAPKLADIRSQLYSVLDGLAVGVVGGVVAEGATVGSVLGGADVMQIIKLINDYNSKMVAVGNAFQDAQTSFAVLEGLDSSKGGIIPTPPRLPAPH
jgi:hypothetical protein